MAVSAGAFASSGACSSVGTIAAVSYSWNGTAYTLCELPSSITTDETLFNGNDTMTGQPVLWALPGIVTVGDGYEYGKTPATANDAELTIESGVNVIATASNAALVISRGATISAVGTANDPIVFSSSDENYTGEGEWGGVILSGFGVANECNSGSDTCLMEGISSDYYFGGSLSTTMGSGILKYVVITEGGSEINVNDPDDVANGGDEINGLTLYAVNDTGTTIEYVHINENYDDGIEFFGGDVAVSDIWLTCNGDDSVDWDYGFHGSIENVYIEQGDKNGAEDYAFELAGNPNNSAATPLASATVTGAWVQYNGSNAATMTDAIFKLKEGTGNTNGTANGVVGGTPLFDEIVITGYAGQECAEISSANISTDSFEAVSYDCAITAAADGKFVPTGSSSFTYNNSFWTAPACL
tara:strand:- start:2109 stop:3350 length:1242 start_codon:yes stop_codon:yes gene_type:complete